MIILQVSLNFDPVKEILKIRCQIYILMEKVIILRKIHVTIKSFAPPLFSHLNLSLNRKKSAAIRAVRKKPNIFTLQLPIYYILEQEISIGASANIAKTKQEKYSLCCREVDTMLIASAKIPEREGSILLSSFYGQLHDYQSHVLNLSTQQLSSSFCS